MFPKKKKLQTCHCFVLKIFQGMVSADLCITRSPGTVIGLMNDDDDDDDDDSSSNSVT